MHYIKKAVFILFTGICAGPAAMAQPGFGIEGNLAAGRIFKHTARFKGPIPALSGAADLNFVWKTYGKSEWQQRRCYPTVGLGFTYAYYDNRHYGQSIGFYPNLQLPLIERKNWEWTLRFGMGLGYISKGYTPYAPEWDTLNNAIGARINNFSLLSSDIRYHLDEHWDIQAGISFTHMSSAKFRLPNLGINFIGGHIGFRYFPASSQPAKITRQLKPLRNRLLLQARQGIAVSTGESPGSAATPVYLSSLYLSKRYWGKNKVFAGIDYSYHQSIYDFMRLQGLETGNEKQHAWKSGLFAGHEFLYGRVGLHLQFGVYIHQALLRSAPIYQKLGMNWYLIQKEKGLIKELSISTLLKTHYSTAELAELGVGISL
ncbi:MAG: acyloxyacyl hydrolase [Chitinophagaceae bacterium]|nr:acyloxyacyl hydrolase [Chitinophagaceae bacterium]